MKNPFRGPQGIATVVGIVFTGVFLIFEAIGLQSLTKIIGGIFVWGSIILLFFRQYRPWGRGFLIGCFAPLVLGLAFFLLISVMLAFLRGAGMI